MFFILNLLFPNYEILTHIVIDGPYTLVFNEKAD